MANATPAAARMGWDLFRRSGFSLTLAEINDRLEALDLTPVSPRTHNHYRSLAAAGYSHYVSINRFDIARAAKPFEDATARNIYEYLDVDLGVEVTFVKSGEPFTAVGRARRLSEAGTFVEVDVQQFGEGLRALKLRSGHYVRLDFLGQNRPSAHGRLVGDIEFAALLASFEVEFRRIRPVTELVPGVRLPEDRSTIRLLASSDGSDESSEHSTLIAADLVGRRIYYLLEALEITRAMVNEVLDHEGVGGRVRAEQPFVASLRMASPLELAVSLAQAVPASLLYGWGLYKGLFGAADRGIDLLQKNTDRAKSQAEIEILKEEARRLNLENDALQDRNLTTHVIHKTIRQSLHQHGTQLGDKHELTSRFLNLDKQLEEVVARLIEQGVSGLEAEPTEAP